MRVNLRCCNTGMPQHCLNASNIRAVCQKVGGETVPQSMRSYFFCNAGFDRVIFDNSLNTSWRESWRANIPKANKRLFAFGMFALCFFTACYFSVANKQRRIHIFSSREIINKCVFCRVGNKNQTDFVSFAADGKLALFQVYVFPV